MYSTTDDQGLLNNFAKEPKVYYADAPSAKEQRNYVLQGVVAAILVSAVVAVSFVVS